MDEPNLGVYTVTIKGQGICNSATASYPLDVKSQCWVDQFPIDEFDSVFGFPSLVQNVWQPS